jgi:hypothetical protein
VASRADALPRDCGALAVSLLPATAGFLPGPDRRESTGATR